jgi:hypothetical protein
VAGEAAAAGWPAGLEHAAVADTSASVDTTIARPSRLGEVMYGSFGLRCLEWIASTSTNDEGAAKVYYLPVGLFADLDERVQP